MSIKGQMIIELADAKTGKIVERHHDNNLVTNGVKHYFKNMGMMNTTPFNTNVGAIFTNHPDNLAIPLFGGLMLFDTAQTENAEHIFVSGGTKMTGNGINGYTSNDTVTEFGSFNSQESGWQEDGSFKQVWDFTTTQANGTIACACLCPYNYAAYGEGNSSSKVQKTNASGMTASNNGWWGYNGYPQTKRLLSAPANADNFGTNFEAYPIKIDMDNNYAILLGYNSGQTPCQFKYVKVAFPCSKWDIRDGYSSNGRKLGIVQNITLPSQVTNYNNRWATRPICFLGRDSSGATYFAINTVGYNVTYFNTNNPLIIVKFVVGANDAVTCEYVMTLTPSVIGETTGNFYYNSPHCLQVIGDNLFLATGTTYNAINKEMWFKISLPGQTVERVTDNTISTFVAFAEAGRRWHIPDSDSVYFHSGGFNTVKVDLTAKEVVSLNSWESAQVSGLYGLIDNKTAFYYSNGDVSTSPVTGQIYRWMRFLSTINNLESPVVKTADKTMKVTYVLRFDAEE